MAKRQKLLQELSGVGGVSDKSMARVMQFVQQNPLVVEGPIANQQLGRAALEILDDIGTERHTFVLKDGKELEWTYLPLQKLLPFLCRCCHWFRMLLSCTLQSNAPPWSTITYNDGFTPGNVLRINNQRKSSVWEVSLKELGGYLCHSELWLPLGVLRTAS